MSNTWFKVSGLCFCAILRLTKAHIFSGSKYAPKLGSATPWNQWQCPKNKEMLAKWCLQVELNRARPGLLVWIGVVHQTLRLSSWWWRGATLAKAGLVAIKPYDFFTLAGSCIWWIVTGKGSTTLSCVGLGCHIGVALITCGGMGNTCMLMDCSLMAVNPVSFGAKALGFKHVRAWLTVMAVICGVEGGTTSSLIMTWRSSPVTKADPTVVALLWKLL